MLLIDFYQIRTELDKFVTYKEAQHIIQNTIVF